MISFVIFKILCWLYGFDHATSKVAGEIFAFLSFVEFWGVVSALIAFSAKS